MYVESPIKVDSFFPIFCIRFLGIVIKFKSIFLNVGKLKIRFLQLQYTLLPSLE
jgi:hypothetical protein